MREAPEGFPGGFPAGPRGFPGVSAMIRWAVFSKIEGVSAGPVKFYQNFK